MVVTPAAPSRLTARQRTRRAARGGASRSVPVPLLAPALIAVAFLVLPLAGLLIRAPWGRMGAALSGSDATQALVLSLWTASVSTVISLVIGVPLAWVLAVNLHMRAEGAFLAIVIAECSMAVAGIVLFRQGRWKKQKI